MAHTYIIYVRPSFEGWAIFITRGLSLGGLALKGLGGVGKAIHLAHFPIYHTLISTSTPEGSSSFISASIVLGVDE